MDTAEWSAKAPPIWQAKPALREYYRHQIFDRIQAAMAPGRALELGTGPGFLAAHIPGLLTSDLAPAPAVAVCTDAHALAFADASFGNVVGVDVLHHLARPGAALGEVARVLRAGGRMVLVEPWTSPLGWLFYRYIHYEACERMDDPWCDAYRADKTAMEGNAMIARTLFVTRRAELARYAPGLRVARLEPFGFLAFLMTGGFRPWSFPPALVRVMTHIERAYPRALIAALATRVLVVLEKDHRA